MNKISQELRELRVLIMEIRALVQREQLAEKTNNNKKG